VDTLECGHKLGMALMLQGKVKEANKCLSEVYEERKSALGEDHKDTLDTLQVLKGKKDKN